MFDVAPVCNLDLLCPLQAAPFALLSEYAPPPNPSSDHLVASNPFDDSYNSPPAFLKPPNNLNPYFGQSHGCYGPPRMVPHVQNRMPAPFGSPFQIRNQPHPFSQNPMGPMGFNRVPGFSYMHPENPAFANQPGINNNGGMHQNFRPGPADNLNQLSLSINQNHGPDTMFCPELTVCGNRPTSVQKTGPDMSPGLNFSATPKQEPSETRNKNITPAARKPNQVQEEGRAPDSQAELKGKNKSKEVKIGGVEKLNGVLHSSSEPLKKSPQLVTENSGERNRRSSSNKTSKRNRLSGSAPSEPMYPCGICLREVNDDQEAILCEASCQKWFHRLCTGMTETAYNLLTAETAAVWGCDTCMDKKEGVQLLKTREGSSTARANSKGQT